MEDPNNLGPGRKPAMQDPLQETGSPPNLSPTGTASPALIPGIHRGSAAKHGIGKENKGHPPGNAFAMMKTRPAKTSKLPRRSIGKTPGSNLIEIVSSSSVFFLAQPVPLC